MQDICIDLGPCTVNLRAAAILRSDDRVLDRGRPFHEICFVYEARWTAPHPPTPPPTATETLRWLTPAELDAIDLRPTFIKPHLRHPPSALRHLVNRDV